MTRTGTPFGASPRDFGLRDRASGVGQRGHPPPDSEAFAPFVLPSSSPCGQPHVVGADGDPRPPGSPADEAEPAGAAPHPDRMRLMKTPSVGWDAIRI